MSTNPRDRLLQLYSDIGQLNEGLEMLAPVIESQIALFDDPDITSEKSQENSLAFQIAHSIKNFDSRFLSKSLTREVIEKMFNKSAIGKGAAGKRYNLIDNRIICNLEATPRYRDEEDPPLDVETLFSMSDLDYLSQINAYQICYCGHQQGRTKYEHFLNSLIDLLFTANGELPSDNYDKLVFNIIHDTSYLLHIITEYTISIVQSILEIVTIVNTRIKTANLSIRLDMRLPPIKHPIFTHISACFQDPLKIYSIFKSRKIIDAHSGARSETPGKDDWASKLRELDDSLMSSCQDYIMQSICMFEESAKIKTQLSKIAALSGNSERYVELEIYVAKVTVFIIEFQNFLNHITNNSNTYKKLYLHAQLLLNNLEFLESEYPTIYGEYETLDIKTPRNQPSARQNLTTSRGRRSGRSSGNNSPSNSCPSTPRIRKSSHGYVNPGTSRTPSPTIPSLKAKTPRVKITPLDFSTLNRSSGGSKTY